MGGGVKNKKSEENKSLFKSARGKRAKPDNNGTPLKRSQPTKCRRVSKVLRGTVRRGVALERADKETGRKKSRSSRKRKKTNRTKV